MSFADKLKFWKRKDPMDDDFMDDYDSFDDSSMSKEQPGQTNSQDNLNMGRQNEYRPGQDDMNSYPQPKMGDYNQFADQRNQTDMEGPIRRDAKQFFSGSDHIGKPGEADINMQTINMKLDSIRAYLDLINSKLDRLEHDLKKNKPNEFRYT